MKSAIVGFMLLVMAATIKAHIHFMRLALLCILGLAGMWMMHKLAQDWQKISGSNRPVQTAGRLLGLWKRSIPDATMDTYVEESMNNFYKFDEILKFDKSMCARKMVCQIAATPKNLLNQVEVNILKMLSPDEHFGDNPAKDIFRKAMDLGHRKKSTKACDAEYKKCRFNTHQMFKLFTSFM
ncbi:uncharacterized protein LOC126836471 [Adelges cooleyi]|uniref:uncharacterized protein LOC126836471 n=1 Tax=Adelges cooleyi TaxID=133065 RepID=UPI00217F5111|nr:uncharacterized protein LOC126836471 [Adelges cooleyi]XP_050425887.1 uncharacterized protein LOC126836471 [Adelges cooleyi]XP_050425888.1 uncharacterized protein LOC126836471 [Adelges cooleyi]